jgi:curved DNA-binding protein CbpA
VASNAKTDPLRHKVLEKLAGLEQGDHYALLEVEPHTTAAEIKRAYFQAAKLYHPDALSRLGLDAETREMASRVFSEIGKAHAVLSDPERRRAYDATLKTDSTQIDANLLAQAETLFRKADILIKAGNFRGALDFAEPAVELWPEECAYQSALGWVLYKKTPSEPERAREHLERAARCDPNDGVNLFRLSAVLDTLGEKDASAKAQERAQSLGAR